MSKIYYSTSEVASVRDKQITIYAGRQKKECQHIKIGKRLEDPGNLRWRPDREFGFTELPSLSRYVPTPVHFSAWNTMLVRLDQTH